MKLKLLIAVTILAVIGVIVIAAVKKSEQTPVIPEMTIETQVETEWDVNLDSLGGKDETFEKSSNSKTEDKDERKDMAVGMDTTELNKQINDCLESQKCRDSMHVVLRSKRK